MTPAPMGLTLAGFSEIRLRFRPSVVHHMGRFVGMVVVAAWLVAGTTGGAVG